MLGYRINNHKTHYVQGKLQCLCKQAVKWAKSVQNRIQI